MNDFLKHYSDRLYKMEPSGKGPEETYLVLPSPLSRPEETLPLSEAVQNQTGHNGLLIFSGQALSITDQIRADEFADSMLSFFRTRAKTDRALIWLCQEDSSGLPCRFFMGISRDASLVTSSLCVPLVTNLDFLVQNGSSMTFDKTHIQITAASDSCVSFAGSRTPKGYAVRFASLSLAGDAPGSFHYDVYFQKDSFLACLNPGFSLSFSSHESDGSIPKTINFPLFSPDGPPSCLLGFHALISPARRYDRNAHLQFLPSHKDSLKLHSFFTTIYGDPLYLQPVTEEDRQDCAPAGFAFCSRPDHALPLCPEGDFRLWNPSGHGADLMCGISATEYIRFDPGDTLRFLWGSPGFVPAFPLPRASTVEEPVDLEKEPVKHTYLTSWACLCQARAPLYLTQPEECAITGLMNPAALTRNYCFRRRLSAILIKIPAFPCSP